MADSDKLRNYTRVDQPTIDGNDRKFIQNELQKIQTSIALLITVVKALDARMTAHGF